LASDTGFKEIHGKPQLPVVKGKSERSPQDSNIVEPRPTGMALPSNSSANRKKVTATTMIKMVES